MTIWTLVHAQENVEKKATPSKSSTTYKTPREAKTARLSREPSSACKDFEDAEMKGLARESLSTLETPENNEGSESCRDSSPTCEKPQKSETGVRPRETSSKYATGLGTETTRETEDLEPAQHFSKIWHNATEDNPLSLYGFQRFKTSHLLNLRFLELEIGKVDRQIFQAGLTLEATPHPNDKLGLRDGKRDENAPAVEDVINRELVLKLRDLVRQYGT